MYFLLILISILVSEMMWSYTSYSSVSQWITAESSSSYKWCRYYQDYTYGYSWTSSDTSTYCGGSSYYRCSTDTTYLPTNSKKLLCPKDSSNWNTHDIIFNPIINKIHLLIIIELKSEVWPSYKINRFTLKVFLF